MKPLFLIFLSVLATVKATPKDQADAKTLGDVYEDENTAGSGRASLGDVYEDTSSVDIRWASSGGGWRAMVASMGFANAFRQAGLFSANSSKLSAISTNSGSSWFSSQLFYSPNFYQQTVMTTPEELYNFTTLWMKSYEAISDYVVGDNELCNTTDLGNSTEIQVFSEWCELVFQYEGNWANFIAAMLLATSTAYGDPSFLNRTANAANRIAPLQQTDLYVMTALSPSSRVRLQKVPLVKKKQQPTAAKSELAKENEPFDRLRRRRTQLFGEIDDIIVYLGPATNLNEEEEEEEERLYTTTQAASYVVSSSNEKEGFYFMSDGHSSDDFLLYKGQTPYRFDFGDFDDFFLYQQKPGTVTIENDPSFLLGRGGGELLEESTFRPPFGGGAASVTQIASISSAVVATMSPASSITFAQALDKAWAELRESLGPILLLPSRILFNAAVNRIYRSPLFDTIAVCSQWPSKACGDLDGYFLDGGVVENNALSATISQYQLQNPPAEADADADAEAKPLKVILTNTNREWISDYDLSQILQYFDAPLNDGVEPGGHLSLAERTVPIRSPQLFQDFLDLETLNDMLVPIQGSNMTTATMSLTTIDNPVYGITAGLPVELLLINLNEPLTTVVVGPMVIANLTAPHAEMARKIASNDILVQRVRNFYEASIEVSK